MPIKIKFGYKKTNKILPFMNINPVIIDIKYLEGKSKKNKYISKEEIYL